MPTGAGFDIMSDIFPAVGVLEGKVDECLVVAFVAANVVADLVWLHLYAADHVPRPNQAPNSVGQLIFGRGNAF